MDERKQEITAAVGARIRYFRHLRNLSQEEVAGRANLNAAFFGQVERGLKCPTIDTLYKIASALEVPLPELVRVDVPPGSASSYSMSQSPQISDLLARIPEEKQAKLLKIIAELTDLF